MKNICLIHLVRAGNDFESFRCFMVSYRKYPAGVSHDLVIVFKGFGGTNTLNEYQKYLNSFNYIPFEVSDKGCDLDVYFFMANTFKKQYRYFCFINSFSEILASNWLKKLFQAALIKNVGLVGATGSWQSICDLDYTLKQKITYSKKFSNLLKIFKILKYIKYPIFYCIYFRNLYVNRFYNSFPNSHIRTNAFLISSHLINTIKKFKTRTKLDAYIMESGKRGLSSQISSMGMQLRVVGRNGKAYKSADWNISRTFWQFNQDNLLIADNQTRKYSSGSFELKKRLSYFAWKSMPFDITQKKIFPLVSICIPFHNSGKFLLQAINSVLDQTYSNIELILFDNASSDLAPNFLEGIVSRDKRFILFKNKKNIGLVKNFNACLSKARGNYIKFLCADDLLTPNCIELMVNNLEKNKSATLVTGKRLIIDQNNEILGAKSYLNSDSLINGRVAINRCLFGANYIGEPSAVMFRRAALVELFNIDFPHLVDLEMWFRLLEKGDLASIRETVCMIRQHPSQMTKYNIKSSNLVDDNVRLYDLYKNKAYIHKTFLRSEGRKLRMAYRIWISRNYIKTKRKKEILELQSNSLYYLCVPCIIFLINIFTKFKKLVFRAFTSKLFERSFTKSP